MLLSFLALAGTTIFSSIHMVNDTTGWATTNGTAQYTTDGGVTWKNVTPSGSDSFSHQAPDLYSLDEKNAWIFLTTSNQRSTIVYQTSNRGQSWHKASIPAHGSPLNVWFIDKDHGWISMLRSGALGSEGEAIYQTSNGGATWHKVSITNDVKGGALPFGGDKTGASFIDANRGWATGYSPADGVFYLYRTTDDGHTWNSQQVPIPDKVKGAQFVSQPPIFFNRHDGILPVVLTTNTAGFLMYRTTDGGNTWAPTTPVFSAKPYHAFQAWSVCDMTHQFATDGDRLFETSDGGQTWKSISPNISLKNVRQIDFTSPSNGWSLMTSGSLYRTTDGGHTWKKIH